MIKASLSENDTVSRGSSAARSRSVTSPELSWGGPLALDDDIEQGLVVTSVHRVMELLLESLQKKHFVSIQGSAGSWAVETRRVHPDPRHPNTV